MMDIGIRSRKTSKLESPVDDDEKLEIKKIRPRLAQDSHWLTSIQDRIRLVTLTLIGFYLRGMKLGFPYFVTEIELEMTRHVNWYMHGKFFVGQFPPLPGLLNAILARMAGYYGSEDLVYPGQNFTAFPLTALRRLSSAVGAALIPLCYITMRNLGHSRPAATLAAGLLVFENGIITESRFASPEIYALTFAAAATCFWTLAQRYLKNNNQTLNLKTYIWNAVAGVCVGCSMSSKWTGVICFPVLWFATGYELWNKLIKEQYSLRSLGKQLMTYIITLGVIPLFVYLAIFQVHFSVIPLAGDHDFSLSTELKFSLTGNKFEPTQPNVAYGSRLMIKHPNTVGGYLHSHHKYYPEGSGQQEVVLYPHVDLNNIWTMQTHDKIWNNSHPIEYVKNHDTLRLEHFASTRKLHSHDVVAPVSKHKKEHNEVSAYGDRSIVGDPYDLWNLQIFDENGDVSQDKNLTLQPLVHRFRLIHVRGCVLSSAENFHSPNEEQEVTCMASASQRVTEWLIETSYHENLTDVETVEPAKMNFFKKVKEVHHIMLKYPFKIYNRLQSTGMDNIAITSEFADESPKNWFTKRSSFKVWSLLAGYSSYIFVHPLIQKFTLGSMVAILVFAGINMFINKRQLNRPTLLTWPKPILGIDSISASELYTNSIVLFYSASISYVLFLGFLPNFTISMLDIFPSFYYGVGLFSVVLEVTTLRLRPFFRRTLFYGILLLVLMIFSALSLLAYGGQKWIRSECEKSNLELDCIRFPLTQQEVDDILNDSSNNSTLTMVPIDLPGYTEPFKYHLGNEERADNDISLTKYYAFLQAAEKAPGALRYNRVLPTPAISPDEATQWRQAITQQAAGRERHAQKEKMEQWAKYNNVTLHTYKLGSNQEEQKVVTVGSEGLVQNVVKTVTDHEKGQVQVIHQEIVYVTAEDGEAIAAEAQEETLKNKESDSTNEKVKQIEQPIVPEDEQAPETERRDS